MRAARRALLRTRAMLARRLSPFDSSLMRARRKGVASLPLTPRSAASSTARSIQPLTRSKGISASGGTGWHTNAPPGMPSAPRSACARAINAGSSMRKGAMMPERRDQKAGSSSVPWAITGTPRVSSASNVSGRSRIALAPAHTTITGVCASSSRSADMSKLRAAPRCTPPMPPVANAAMPAARAAIMVAATVVEPVAPVARATARSARLTLSTSRAVDNASSAVPSNPTRSRPSETAMVAGTAPAPRTSASTARAVSRLVGEGMPCVMMVDSSATTGRPSFRASATSGWMASGIDRVMGPGP